MKVYYVVRMDNLHVTDYALGDGIDEDFNRVKELKEIKLSSKTNTEKKISDISEAYAVAKNIRGFVIKITTTENDSPVIEIIKNYEKR